MKMLSTVFAVMVVTVLALPGVAHAAGHLDTVMHYVSCDGSNWSASWAGNKFSQTLESGGASHTDPPLTYKTWDGTCWQLKWIGGPGAGQFSHTPVNSSGIPTGAASHLDYVVDYLTWDGGKWTSFRANSTNFYHIGPF